MPRPRHLLLLVALVLGCQRKQAAVPPAPPAPPDAAAPVDPATAERTAIIRKVAGVFNCFEARMKEATKKDPDLALYGRNSFTDVFVFDRLFGDRQTIDKAPEELCETLVSEYQRIYRTVAKATPARRGGVKPLPVDARPEFIRAAHSRTALHMLRHAEITQAALTEVFGRPRPVVEAVAFGAAATDIYAWADARYQAQTNPFDSEQRENEIQTSQVAFVGAMTALLDRFREDSSDGNFDRSSIVLGILCHAAQDLAFHHGMTRKQIAELRFFGVDPYGSESAAMQAEAKRWTKEVIGLAQKAVRDRKLWDRFAAWTPPAGFDLDTPTVAAFREDQQQDPLNLVALTRTWLATLAFRGTPAARAELADSIRWDPPALFERIRRARGNSQVALRGDRR
jgi:hypothetical protein